jgi:hypothetical protein
MEKIVSVYCVCPSVEPPLSAPRLVLEGEHIGEESAGLGLFKNWTNG